MIGKFTKSSLFGNFILILFSTFFSCVDGEIFPSTSGPTSEGWVGLYVDSSGFQNLHQSSNSNGYLFNQPLFNYRDSSHFIVIPPYRYRLDSLKGIIIQYANEELYSSSSEGYFLVPGIRSIKEANGELIVDNFSDEVVLSVAGSPELSVIERRVNRAAPFVYPEEKPERIQSIYNSERSSYFQCYDPTKGILIGWRLVYSSDLECHLNPL